MSDVPAPAGTYAVDPPVVDMDVDVSNAGRIHSRYNASGLTAGLPVLSAVVCVWNVLFFVHAALQHLRSLPLVGYEVLIR